MIKNFKLGPNQFAFTRNELFIKNVFFNDSI